MLVEFSHGIKHFDASAVELLCAREWKGNVRELRNTIERISILVAHRMITAEHLQQLGIDNVARPSSQLAPLLKELLGSSPRHDNLPDRLEQELIKVALVKSSGNVTQAARLLGIDRMTLQRRIEKHGLQPK
jgi:DNA-binding NtrC family response regulator